MITHGPPYQVLDQTSHGEYAGCQNLLEAGRRARPLLHAFGHIHEGWGMGRMKWSKGENESFEREYSATNIEGSEAFKYTDLTSTGPKPLQWGMETAMVNSSIMNVRYKPVQKPWVIDIDLPVKEDKI